MTFEAADFTSKAQSILEKKKKGKIKKNNYKKGEVKAISVPLDFFVSSSPEKKTHLHTNGNF